MTTTRRRFFATLFRSGAAAVALVYAPSLLVTPRVARIPPGTWIPVRGWLVRQEFRRLNPINRRFVERLQTVRVKYRRKMTIVFDYSMGV